MTHEPSYCRWDAGEVGDCVPWQSPSGEMRYNESGFEIRGGRGHTLGRSAGLGRRISTIRVATISIVTVFRDRTTHDRDQPTERTTDGTNQRIAIARWQPCHLTHDRGIDGCLQDLQDGIILSPCSIDNVAIPAILARTRAIATLWCIMFMAYAAASDNQQLGN